MKKLWSIIVAFALLCAGQAAAYPSFPKARLTIMTDDSSVVFDADLATTPEQWERGLMYRAHLPESAGMVFLYPAAQKVSMWMKNTYVPLDILFFNQRGEIVRIAADVPPESPAIISSKEPVRGTIELAGGAAEKNRIRVGQRIMLHAASGEAIPFE